MATKYRIHFPHRGGALVVWGYDAAGALVGLVGGESGDLADIQEFPDKTVQATGTIGTTTAINFQGCNSGVAADADNLNDFGGTAINLVPLKRNVAVRENPSHYRPVVGAGTATGIIVRAYCQSTKR